MSIEDGPGIPPEIENHDKEIEVLSSEIGQIREFMAGKVKNDDLGVGAVELLRQINADDNKFHHRYDDRESLTDEEKLVATELLRKVKDGLMDFIRMNSPELFEELKNELSAKA